VGWFETFSSDIAGLNITFIDPSLLSSTLPQVTYAVKQIQPSMHRLSRIVERSEQLKVKTDHPTKSKPKSNEGLIAILELLTATEGPGEMREGGSRHDNDFVNIQDIEIAPTHEELVCWFSASLKQNADKQLDRHARFPRTYQLIYGMRRIYYQEQAWSGCLIYSFVS
jgi:hypothetical protein